MKTYSDAGQAVDLCLIGAKAQAFFGSVGGNVVASVRDIGEEPTVEQLIGAVKHMLDSYTDGTIYCRKYYNFIFEFRFTD